VLDAGIGTGVAAIAASGGECTWSRPVSRHAAGAVEAIEAAGLPNMTLRQGNAYELPDLLSESFAALICSIKFG
jgi:hypothetical protein